MTYARMLLKSKEKETIESVFKKHVLEKNLAFEVDKLTDIQKTVSSLHRITSLKDVDSDDFFATTLKFWLLVFNSGEKRKRGYAIYPSQLRHACSRQLYYEVSRYEYSDEVVDDITPKLQMIFDFGSLIHIYVQAVLWSAGILIKSEVRIKVAEQHLRGRTDGILMWKGEKVILEIKSKNSFAFQKIQLGANEDEQYQASLYADKLGIKKTCFFYVNKDTCEIKVHLVEANTRFAKGANEKLNEIAECVKEEEAPSRDCRTKKEGFDRGCPFVTTCFNARR